MCIFFKKQNTLEAVSWVRLRPQPRVLMPSLQASGGECLGSPRTLETEVHWSPL